MKRCLMLAGVLALAAASGCGGDDEDSGETTAAAPATTATATTQPSTTPTEQAAEPAAKQVPASEVKLGSPSEVPRTKGGDNSIQDFGSEASRAERAAAARVLVSYLRAYAAGDSTTACAHLSSGATQLLEQGFGQAAGKGSKKGAPKSCAEVINALAGGAPRAGKALAAARVLSLRVEGERAFAIYDGAEKQVYAIPMAKEGRAWKVGGIAGTPLT